MKQTCKRCQGQEYDHLPAEKQVFLWKGAYPVKIMVPLTLAFCSTCDSLMRLAHEHRSIERAIENSVPLYLKAIFDRLTTTIELKEIAKKTKVSLKTLTSLRDGECLPDEKVYASVIKFAKSYDKRHQIGLP